jgi:hypothetical protein
MLFACGARVRKWQSLLQKSVEIGPAFGLVPGKTLSAGVRTLSQALIVHVLALILGVAIDPIYSTSSASPLPSYSFRDCSRRFR